MTTIPPLMRARSRRAAILVLTHGVAILALASPGSLSAGDRDKSLSPESIATRLTSASVVHGDFRQKKDLQNFDYSLETNGKFVFWREHGLYLETEEPFPSAMTVKPDTIFYRQGEHMAAGQNTKMSIVQRQINKTLLAFFSIDTTFIENRFNTEWNTSEDAWELTLRPGIDGIKERISLVEIRGSRFIDAIDVRAANGDRTQFFFENIEQSSRPSQKQCRKFFTADESGSCKNLNSKTTEKP